MVRYRRGAGRMGCLFTLLIATAVIYFGVNVGEAYFDFLRYQDRMRGEARFASNISDVEIRARITMFADSLGLPPAAKRIVIRRGAHEVFIYSDYIVPIELPGYIQEIHFSPSAVGKF